MLFLIISFLISQKNNIVSRKERTKLKHDTLQRSTHKKLRSEPLNCPTPAEENLPGCKNAFDELASLVQTGSERKTEKGISKNFSKKYHIKLAKKTNKFKAGDNEEEDELAVAIDNFLSKCLATKCGGAEDACKTIFAGGLDESDLGGALDTFDPDCDPGEDPATPTPVTATPVTATPETATPVTATPVTATPGTATPGTATPETGTPGTATLETGTPGPTTPGTATPGTATTGNQQDESSADLDGNETAEPVDNPGAKSLGIIPKKIDIIVLIMSILLAGLNFTN
jgi:hypothetical protein